MKTILKYPGAKNRLAPWIVSNMPSHEVYLEPFFGSGAVFFNKEPCRIETINDIDDEVYNFFNTVRRDFDMLAEQIRMTPFSRTEYENAFKENENDSSLEKARKFAVKCWMGFGASNRYKNGFRSSQQSSSPSTTKIWNEYPERLLEACSRLKNAQIENLDYRECLSRYDTKDVFIYADPPYMPGVRKGYIYKHEMDEEEHRQLLSLLLTHPGKVMISGYDTPLYSEMLKGWKKEMHKNQVEISCSGAHHMLITPFITAIGQTSARQRNRKVSEPLSTICTKQEHCLVQPMLVQYYGNGHAVSIQNPVPTLTTKDRYALVGTDRNGIELGFRMLQPHELAAATGFPSDYKFTGSKVEVVKQIGNAVPPNFAKAMFSQILSEMTA